MATETDRVDVAAMAGSLRNGSYNRALLRAAEEVAPDTLRMRRVDLAGLPLYDADIDEDARRPDAVREMKDRIGAADGLLISTPEYNRGIPGVLKNAIDWASRPAFRSVLRGTPVGIVGASPGGAGTALAQEQLKQVLSSTLAVVMPHRGIRVARAHERFEDGVLVDEDTRGYLSDFMESFDAFVRRVAAGGMTP